MNVKNVQVKSETYQEKKIVLVTGASSGFGKKICVLAAQNGYLVLATMRRAHERRTLFDDQPTEVRSLIKILPLDITSEVERQDIVDVIRHKYKGQLDFLVNNAGVGVFGPSEDLTSEEIRYQMEVNFFSPILLTKSLLFALRKSKGKVINISSAMGTFSLPQLSLYSASKHALEGWSEGLRMEMKQYGVDVCTVRPGMHGTEFNKNIQWSKKILNPNGVYIEQTRHLRLLMDRLHRSFLNGDEIDVAEKVLILMKRKELPRSVFVGLDAQIQAYSQKFLPYFLREKFFQCFL